MKRIIWGLFLIIAGIFCLIYVAGKVSYLNLENLEEELPILINTLAFPLLVVGIFFLIFGFVLFMDGRTIVKRTLKEKVDSPQKGFKSMKGERKRPPKELPDDKLLEVPATKRCPKCERDIYKEARVCRFCAHEFPVTYRLKVYRPDDEGKYRFLVEKLSERLSRPEDAIEHLLDVGMRFKFSSKEHLEENKIKFEGLGCPMETYEKVSRE